MADFVQSVMERMLPDLEDLQRRGIFSPDEIRSIVKRRRDFEYALRKRVAEPQDYVRYIEYELNLEALRRLRKSSAGMRKTTRSDHAGLRHIHYIFNRAVRRFDEDLRWWLQWLDFSLRSQSSRTTDRIFARALQMHPRSEELWLQAAEYQFDRLHNMSAARTLLQRALRVNGESRKLWLAYFRMECLYILKLRGRRVLMGLPAPIGGMLPEHSLVAGVGELTAASAEADGGAEVVDAGFEPDFDTTTAVAAAGESEDGTAPVSTLTELSRAWAGTNDIAEQTRAAEGRGAGSTSVKDEEAVAASARDQFFAGAIPQIIFDNAIKATPAAAADLQFRIDFHAMVDTFRDTLASALSGEEAMLVPPPAFPALHTHIVNSIARDFALVPKMWEFLATLPLRHLTAAALRLRRRARKVAKLEAGAVAPTTGAHDGTAADELNDEDLFKVDTAPSAGAGHADALESDEEEPEREAGAALPRDDDDAAHAEDAHTPSPTSDELDTRFLLSQSLGDLDAAAAQPAPSAAAWLRSLADGSFDAAAVPSAARRDAHAQVPVLQPLRAPLWTVSRAAPASASSATAGTAPPAPAVGTKRRRAAAAVPPTADAPATDRAVLSVTQHSLSVLVEDSTLLLAAWDRATGEACDALQSGFDVAPSLHMAAAAARVLVRLIAQPLPDCTATRMRQVRLLSALVEVGDKAASYTAAALPLARVQAARDEALTPSQQSEFEATVELACALAEVHAQALLRLGRVTAALQRAEGLTTTVPACARAWMLRARLVAHLALRAGALQLRGASPEAALAAAMAEEEVGAMSAGVTREAAALDLEATRAFGALHSSAATTSASTLVAKIITAARATVRAADARSLIVAQLQLDALSSPDAMAVSSALAATAGSALAARPTPAVVDALLAVYFALAAKAADAALSSAAHVKHRVPASALVAAFGAHAVRVLSTAAVPSEHIYGIAIAAVQRVAASAGDVPCVEDVRRIHELAVSRLGTSSVSVWLQYFAFERDVMATSVRATGGDRASALHARAVRALRGAKSNEFVELVSTLNRVTA